MYGAGDVDEGTSSESEDPDLETIKTTSIDTPEHDNPFKGVQT
jgi:hypothetical protein